MKFLNKKLWTGRSTYVLLELDAVHLISNGSAHFDFPRSSASLLSGEIFWELLVNNYYSFPFTEKYFKPHLIYVIKMFSSHYRKLACTLSTDALKMNFIFNWAMHAKWVMLFEVKIFFLTMFSFLSVKLWRHTIPAVKRISIKNNAKFKL